MTEEQVTLAAIAWLRSRNHEILSYDYPGSGTGRLIRPVGSTSKSAGWKPDIVSVCRNVAFCFENKPRLFLPDVRKLNGIKNNPRLCLAIAAFANVEPANLRFGIAVGDLDLQRLTMCGLSLDFALHATGPNITIAVGTCFD